VTTAFASPRLASPRLASPSTAIAMALHGYNLLSEQRVAGAIGHHEHRTHLHAGLRQVRVWSTSALSGPYGGTFRAV
jgi:hypothetical protein